MKLPRTYIVYQSQVGYEEMKLPRTHIVYQSQVGYEEMKLPRTHIVYQSQVGFVIIYIYLGQRHLQYFPVL
jgi:hypothetical protein